MNPAQMTAPRTGNGARAAAKILFDRMGAAIALLVLSPVLAAIALGIRFTMGTPVFQDRQRDEVQHQDRKDLQEGAERLGP